MWMRCRKWDDFSCGGAGMTGNNTFLKSSHDRALAIPRFTQANELLKEIEQSPLQAIQGDSAMKSSWNPFHPGWAKRALSHAACLPATVTSSFTPDGKPRIVCMSRHSFGTSPLHLRTWWWGCCILDLTIHLPCWQVLEVGLLLRAPPERPVGGAQWALHVLVMADKLQQGGRCNQRQKKLQDCLL